MIDLGLSKREYYSLTRYEYLCKYTRWVKQGYERLEGARLIAYYTVKMQADPKKFKQTIAEFMPFATDMAPAKPKVKIVSKEEMNRIANRFPLP